MPMLVIVLAALALMLTPAAAAKKTVCRDAKTGQYVSVKYAKHYPGLTVCEKK